MSVARWVLYFVSESISKIQIGVIARRNESCDITSFWFQEEEDSCRQLLRLCFTDSDCPDK